MHGEVPHGLQDLTGPAGRCLRGWPVLVQVTAANEARRAAALDAQVERLVARRVREDDEKRELREQLTAAQDSAAAAQASAEQYRAAMEQVGVPCHCRVCPLLIP